MSFLGFGSSRPKVRYAVIGLGDISQAAFLPGVSHTGNSEVTALVTSDPKKAAELGRQYDVENTFGYDEMDELIGSGLIDAMYIATPNWRHEEFAVPALEAGIHVLLEKPMEVSSDSCERILRAQKKGGASLMLAYRLHFEPATLSLIEQIRAGRLGHLRFFSSVFSQLADPKNHRTKNGDQAGPVFDMAPYPINAARYVFGAEPEEIVSAVGIRSPDLKLGNFDDTVAVTMRFPGDRLAQFTVSYAAAGVNSFFVCGTKGSIEMNPSFTYGEPLEQFRKIDGKKEHESFKTTDQFGGELKYFSDCIIEGRQPEPDGQEGLIDVQIIEAIMGALKTGRPQKLKTAKKSRRIETSKQKQTLDAIKRPKEVHASSPSLN